MSNSLWYIIAKLRDSDSYPTVGIWTKHTVIHVSSHSIYSQTLMRIAESSVLEFDLVRKILSVLVVVVRLPGVPLHRRRPPFLLVSFPPRPRGFYRSEGSWLFHPVTFRTDLRISNVQLSSSISKRQKNKFYIFHGPFRVSGYDDARARHLQHERRPRNCTRLLHWCYTSDARLFIESLGDCHADRDSCQPRTDFDCCLFGQDVTRVATHTANFGRWSHPFRIKRWNEQTIIDLWYCNKCQRICKLPTFMY